MKTNLQINFTLAAALAIASSLALASGDHGKPATTSQAATATPKANTPASKEMVDAEVRKIDVEAKKITLKHGPIKSLDMPGMTMVFQAPDAATVEKLKTLKVGDKVRFNPEQRAGAFVVTDIEKN